MEHGTPVHAGTVFAIASMSKAFTAAAVILLVEEGKLALEAPISRYLPEAPPSWSGITVRRLLDHTSGIPEDWAAHPPPDDPRDAYFLRLQSDEAFLRALFERPLDFPPGTDFRYTCGTFVLGVAIARVTGVPYPRFMRERVFEPLGLSSTSVNDIYAVVPHRAAGYSRAGGVTSRGLLISPAAHARGDVGIITTARDMAAFWTSLRRGRLLRASSVDTVFAPGRLANGSATPAGFGWFVDPVGGRTRIGHGGVFRTGFTSTITSYPDDDLTVIVLSNLMVSGTGAIARRIAGAYVEALGPISDRKPVPDPDARRTAVLGNALKAVAERRIDAQSMVPGFPVDYYDDDARSSLRAVTGVTYLGEERLVPPRDLFGVRAGTIVYARLDGPTPLHTAFALTEHGKVAYFDYPEP